MNIGIVGLGYWGNIILKTLEKMGENEITLCDVSFSNNNAHSIYKTYNNYEDLDVDYVFITTPTETHFEISKFFLDKGVNVFCEKPLTKSSKQAEILYEIAIKNKNILFTDWIFTFNSHINTIKNDYINGKLGDIRSIFMNRLNLGPKRYDVNARWDLASHDISIILYIFSKLPSKIRWIDYRRNNNSKQEDSCLGLLEYDDFVATINVSWQYMKKVRECIFEFNKYYVLWDDYRRILQYEDLSNVKYPIYSGNLSYPCSSYQEPLLNSINAFFSFSEKDIIEQKELTIQTIKILERE